MHASFLMPVYKLSMGDGLSVLLYMDALVSNLTYLTNAVLNPRCPGKNFPSGAKQTAPCLGDPTCLPGSA